MKTTCWTCGREYESAAAVFAEVFGAVAGERGECDDCHRERRMAARRGEGYCTQNHADCMTCSLVNYGLDCHNNPVPA